MCYNLLWWLILLKCRYFFSQNITLSCDISVPSTLVTLQHSVSGWWWWWWRLAHELFRGSQFLLNDSEWSPPLPESLLASCCNYNCTAEWASGTGQGTYWFSQSWKNKQGIVCTKADICPPRLPTFPSPSHPNIIHFLWRYEASMLSPKASQGQCSKSLIIFNKDKIIQAVWSLQTWVIYYSEILDWMCSRGKHSSKPNIRHHCARIRL